MVLVGQRAVRTDAFEKVTGAALYVGDLRLPGLLTGKVLRSPLPHAYIRAIDTTRAARVPGVRAVITAADTPRLGWGPFLPDQWPLAIDKVYYDDFCSLSRWAQKEKATEQPIDFKQLTWPDGLKAIDAKLVDPPPPPC